ncbi:hypothetical protein OKA04_14335 [Luteolibacter flavescens]|uniref:Uncharacterized protein n=1 Tax=Luteolibacter flavescens TaxID=1859460 RepID=A0ABT3FRJ0_9BACT|nr:hypothetical protein [Luteolibacter flavescens]MCW1885914.1 hypothetical protein [Luteolibacter flavescens]
MKSSPYLMLLAVVACGSLTSCAQMAEGFASAAVDSVIDGIFDRDDDDFESEALRSHLRHGDSWSDARRAAKDDVLFNELSRPMAYD